MTFGVTARHVLGTREPSNLRVPDMLQGPAHWIRPHEIFWYNSGQFDHYADVAVLVLPRAPATVDDGEVLASPAFDTPLKVGDRLFVNGFPKCLSYFHYEAHKTRRQKSSKRAPGARIYWNDELFAATHVKSETLGHWNTLHFENLYDIETLDGMSGSPVYRIEATPNDAPSDLTLVGMLVRGSVQSKTGYFLGAHILANVLARVAGRFPEAREYAAKRVTKKDALDAVARGLLFVAGGNKAIAIAAALDPDGAPDYLTAVMKRVAQTDPGIFEKTCGKEAAELILDAARSRGWIR